MENLFLKTIKNDLNIIIGNRFSSESICSAAIKDSLKQSFPSTDMDCISSAVPHIETHK